jgi:hypothetical protein
MKNRINIDFEHYLGHAKLSICTFPSHLADKRKYSCHLKCLDRARSAFLQFLN